MVVIARRSGSRMVSSSSLVLGFLLSASLVLVSSVLFASGLSCSSACGRRRFARTVGQVRTDRLPRLTFVAGLQQELRALIKNVRILRREGQRRIGRGPVIAIAADVGRDGLDLSIRAIDTPERASFSACINDIGVGGIGNDVAELVTADRVPIQKGDCAVISAAQSCNRSAVLLRAVNPVREAIIGRDVIDLAGRLVVPRGPGLAAIHADGRALIAAHDHVIGVRGIDPERVIVVAAGSALVGFECDAAIRRTVERSLGYEHDV